MGLWIKNDDGSIEKVAGSGGGGGSFDGEHVLTGDVDNPPEELDVGQLMWDGVEGGSGGGGGPHDHDYLPLTGGAVTGDLTVDGLLRLKGASESHIGNSGSEGREVLEIRATDGGIEAGAGINLYGTGDATNPDRILLYTGNQVTQALETDRSARFYGDLKIDGKIDGTTTINGSINAGYGLYLSGGGGGRSMISNNTGDREILQIRGHLPEGASAADALDYAAGINVYGNGDPTSPGMVRMYSDGQTRFQIDKDGKTQINGWLTIKQSSANTLCLDRTGDVNVDYPVYLGASYNTLNSEKVTAFRVTINGKVLLNIRENETTILKGDLEVDGPVYTGEGQSVYFGGNWSGGRIYNTTANNREYMVVGSTANNGAQLNLYGDNGNDEGHARIYTGGKEALNIDKDQNARLRGNLQVDGTLKVNGKDIGRFGIADGIDTADVLERAETATMPALDEEGVATTNADADGLTVNEVVTALLLKVKELSARIEELEGN